MTMPAKNKQIAVNKSSKEDNALQRVLSLPVVNSACNSLQKSYATTKESHPLVASVCEAYERGIHAAGSLAMWSVKPVIRKLEPQFAAVNILACYGLDHLEQRIPALHKPVEEVTSELKDSICAQVQSTVHTIADTLDRILGLAVESWEQAHNTMREAAEDARGNKASHLAEAGVEAAIGKVEKLVERLLPTPDRSSAHNNSGVHVSREGSPSSIFGRIRALAYKVSQHAFRHTTRTVQYTRDKGQEWATWIPGLGGLAKQNSIKAQGVFSNEQNKASSWLSQGLRKAPEKKEEKKNEEDRTSTTGERAKTRSRMGSLTQNLQAAYLSTISGLEAQFTACNVAGQFLHLSPHEAAAEASTKASLLWEILQNVTSTFLGIVFHYVPVPRLLVKGEETATVTADGSEMYQPQENNQPAATQIQERGPQHQSRGDGRANRGHYPLAFLNLDEPCLGQQAPFQHRSPALEANYTTGARKSAFSPYKEATSSRRLSEGLYRSNSELGYSKAHYAGLYGTVLKKD